MQENGDTWKGKSDDGFKDAVKDAVKHYEDERGKPDRPLTFRVLEMYVTVENPVRDYRVVLGPPS